MFVKNIHMYFIVSDMCYQFFGFTVALWLHAKFISIA